MIQPCSLGNKRVLSNLQALAPLFLWSVMSFSPSSSPTILLGLVKILPLPTRLPRFPQFGVNVSLHHTPKASNICKCLSQGSSQGHFIFRLSMHESDWFTWLWTSKRVMSVKTLPCLTSVTTFGAMPGWNEFSQSCPSLNLWSSVSTFPERLLFPTCKPLHILFPLHGILSTERKSNPSFKATAKDSLITSAQIALSYHSLCLYHTGPLAYLHLHFFIYPTRS